MYEYILDLNFFETGTYNSFRGRKGKNEAHLLNHCCRGKATVITYSECVFVA